MLRIYSDQLVGPAPRFPRDIEDGINQYLAMQAVPEVSPAEPTEPGPDATLPGTPHSEAAIRRTRGTPSIRPF
jgi:hypothetical protein